MKETYFMQTPIGRLKIVSEAGAIIALDHADEAAVVEGEGGPE